MSETIRKGEKGALVKQLTALLKSRGYLNKTRATFNVDVDHAVLEFQARHLGPRGEPLTVDGIVGPLTWWALRNPIMPKAHRPVAQERYTLPARGGSAIGRTALRIAIKEAHAGAQEVGSNNNGPYVSKYVEPIIEAPQEWCAGFVSWCVSQAADPMPFRYHLGARNIRDQFRDKGWLYQPDEQLPEPGDLMFWWRKKRTGTAGHVGIVRDCKDGIVFTIEGNKGGFPAPVRGFDYVLGRIDKLLGFGRMP